MCPEPALLVAYLDGTLFHRDQAAIDHHLETCIECRALLALMLEKRRAERSTKTSRSRITIGAAVVLVAMLGYGVWAVLPRSRREQPDKTTPAVRESPPPAPAASTPVPAPPSASPAPQPVSAQAPTPKPLPRAIAEEPSTLPAPRVLWRTRDVTVESSSDGGMTWVTDHTADRTIRASAFVDAHVAWIVGDSGLILRRTKNGWFGASPPADGNIIAVKASSPSRATVTLEDGRVFTTANGGVTWLLAP
jgi:hypothetical protein